MVDLSTIAGGLQTLQGEIGEGGDGGAVLTALTTGAVPTVISDFTINLNDMFLITTGGTAGVEEIHINTPALPLDAWLNYGLISKRLTFILVVQTDPADVVRITRSDGSTFQVTTANGSAQLTATDGVQLDYVGAAPSFFWGGDHWLLDLMYTDNDYGDFYNVGAVPPRSITGLQGTATTPAQNVTVSAGTAGDAANPNGGLLKLLGGNAAVTPGALGGDVWIAAGPNGDTGYGHVLVKNLPTADPHVVNALWNSAGTLKISAG